MCELYANSASLPNLGMMHKVVKVLKPLACSSAFRSRIESNGHQLLHYFTCRLLRCAFFGELTLFCSLALKTFMLLRLAFTPIYTHYFDVNNAFRPFQWRSSSLQNSGFSFEFYAVLKGSSSLVLQDTPRLFSL